MKGQTLGFLAAGPPGGVGPTLAVGSWRAVVRVLRSPISLRPATRLLDDVITTVFPGECKSCDGPLLRAGAIPVCEACLACVVPSDLFACQRCGDAISLDLDMEDIRFAGLLAEGLQCRACRMAPPAFTRAVSFGAYDDELRTLIHLLKFEGCRAVAPLLGYRLGAAILALEAHAASELLVVAVPLFPARERERGYNQSVLLADAAITWLRDTRPAWRLTTAHAVLQRVKRTESQYALSPKGRRRNLQGAFKVTGNVRNRQVLLIDDILTSGATARECSRVLLAAGASKVWVATVARAQKRAVKQQANTLTATWDLTTTQQLTQQL